jgi:hypothetical protein
MDPLVLGIGAAALILLMRKKKKGAPPPTVPADVDDPVIDEPDQPLDPPPMSDPTGIPKNVIGGSAGLPGFPSTKYPNYAMVVTALTQLGYSMGGLDFMAMATDRELMAMDQVRNAVDNFQRDFKYVAKYVITWRPTLHGSLVPLPPKNKLGVDGWIGKNTWPALKWGHGKVFGQGQSWQEWVAAGKGS